MVATVWVRKPVASKYSRQCLSFPAPKVITPGHRGGGDQCSVGSPEPINALGVHDVVLAGDADDLDVDRRQPQYPMCDVNKAHRPTRPGELGDGPLVPDALFIIPPFETG